MTTTTLTRPAPRHRPERCMTCVGFEPWTDERRQAAATHAACSGRRITHLRPVDEVQF